VGGLADVITCANIGTEKLRVQILQEIKFLLPSETTGHP